MATGTEQALPTARSVELLDLLRVINHATGEPDYASIDQIGNLLTLGSGSGTLLAGNNLSDVLDVIEARNNLGLGSAALAGTGAFDAAGAATTALGAALLKASNLGDLANAATARTNLALGTAAVLNSGTGSGNLILGNDARLTDARTPTAHATSHKTGGTDALRIDELAAPTDVTTNNATTSAHGFCPKLNGSSTVFLAGDGTWRAVSGGGGIGAPGGPWFVVAASNTDTDIQDRADYVCTGTADQTTINLATARGSTLLTDGIFTTTADITVQKSGTTLMGSGLGNDPTSGGVRGGGTHIDAHASFVGTALITVRALADLHPVAEVTVSGINLRGSAVTATAVDGVLFKSHQGHMHHMYADAMSGCGFRIEGYGSADPGGSWDTYDTTLFALFARHCVTAGIRFSTSASDLHLYHSIFALNDGPGVWIHSGSSSQITGIHCYSNLHGIKFEGGGSRTKIANCKIEHSDQHNIYFDGTASNGVSSVQITGCGLQSPGGPVTSTDNLYDQICFAGSNTSTRITIVGCVFGDVSSTNYGRHGINLSTTAKDVVIAGNWLCVPGNPTSGGFRGNAVNFGSGTGGTDTKQRTVIMGNYGCRDHFGSPPVTAVAGANAGTAPPLPVVDGNCYDSRGIITFGSGTGATPGAQLVVTLNAPYTTAGAFPTIYPMNAATAALAPWWAERNSSTMASFTCKCTGDPTDSQANTVYSLGYRTG